MREIYQFHSSSSSVAVAEILATLVGSLESGVITAPKPPVVSASSSSNEDVLTVLRDMGDGDAGKKAVAKGLPVGIGVPPGEGIGEAQAFKNDCDTSEMRMEARFWFFANLKF